MFDPLHPRQFCAHWIPQIYDLHPGDYGYRKACLALLSYLSDCSEATCANWIDYDKFPDSQQSSTRKPPIHLQKFLRVVHLLWVVESNIPSTLSQIRHDLLSN